MMRSLILLLALLSVALWAMAQERVAPDSVRLYGIAKEYSGSELTFFAEEDFITHTRRALGTVAPDYEGAFDITLPLAQTQRIYVELGAYNGLLYAQPGLSYQLVLPPRIDRGVNEAYNPYYVPQEVFLAVINQQQRDLNTLIANLEDSIATRIEPGLAKLKQRANRVVLERLIEAIDAFSASEQNPYFLAYKTYRFHQLRYMVYDRDPEQVLRKHFAQAPLHLNVPTYTDLFSKVAQNALTLKANKNRWSAHPTIESQKGLGALRDSLRRFDYLANPDLRDLYITYGLHNAYFNKNYTKHRVFDLLKAMPESVSLNLRPLVQRVLGKLAHLAPGTLAPDIELLDEAGQPVRLSEFMGKFVYLNFGTSYSMPFVRELGLMQKLREKNIPDLVLLTVSLDSDFAKLLAVKKDNGLDWPFYHYNFRGETIDLYRLKVYPTFYLIGPDGSMLLSPAPAISENFLEVFFEIYQQWRKQQMQIRQGMKN